MVHSTSAPEHDLEAFQELTTQLGQIDVARKTAAYQLANVASQRQQLVEAADIASEITESMDQLTENVMQIGEVMEHFNEVYFGPNGAFTQAIESATMASEFAEEIDNRGLLDDLELASTRLAATSNLATSRLARVATRALSDKLAQSPMYNLGTIQNPFHNSELYEVMQATEQLSEMVDNRAWMGAHTATYPEPPTPDPEPDTTETPFHDDVLETQYLLADYLWAAIWDEGDLSDDLTEGQKLGMRLGFVLLAWYAFGELGTLWPGFDPGVAVGLTASYLELYYQINKRGLN